MAIKEEKERKVIQIGKEKVKLSLFADNMILYIENPKDATKKLLELINELGKVAGYKINAQKSLSFLYTNDEKSEREIKETLPFTTATKIIIIKKQKTKQKESSVPSTRHKHSGYLLYIMQVRPDSWG